MSVIDGGSSLADHARAVARHWHEYDFFFLHFKEPDTRGEDGDFDGKVRAIDALDAAMPTLAHAGRLRRYGA